MELFESKMLKQRRVEVGLSQEQVAELAKVDVRTVRRIENNEVKNSPFLKAICEVLNISFVETNPEEILSKHKRVMKPNVKTGFDLAHLLFGCSHLDYYPDSIAQLEFDDYIVIEEFISNISRLMDIFDCVEAETRQALVSELDEELASLNKYGLFIYGNCNDMLVTDFKYTELVFYKI